MKNYRFKPKFDKGSILVGLIFIMLLFGVLGTVMLRFTTTSTFSQISANNYRRAYYLAESGYRYVVGKYSAASGYSAKMQLLKDVDDKTYKLGNGGSFSLKVYPYWFLTDTAYASGSTSINVSVPGEFSAGLSIPANVSLKIGTQVYNNCSVSKTPPSSATITINAPGLTEDIPQDANVYFALNPDVVQSVNSGGNLTLQAGSDTIIPAVNGQIEADGKNYFYQKMTYDSGSGIATLNAVTGDSGDFPLNADPVNPVILKKFLQLLSTGSIGAGELDVQRTITYDTPVPDLIETTTQEDNNNVVIEDFENLDNWDVPPTDNRVSIQGFQAQGGSHLYWMAIRHLNTGSNRTQDPDNPSCYIGFHTVPLDDQSAAVTAMRDAWNNYGHLLSYDVQVKNGWGYQLDYGAGGLSFRWHKSSTYPTLDEGFGLSFMRYADDSTVCAHVNDGDYIPDSIKPPGMADELIIVLWAQKAVAGALTRQWLAYARLGDPLDRPAARDPKVVGNQWWGDGKVNDNACLLIRIEEKRTDGIAANEIKAFYGDASDQYPGRSGNNVATDLDDHRLRYSPAWLNPAIWPTWPPNDVDTWNSTVDYFTMAADYPPPPDNALFWTVNPAAVDIELTEDGTNIHTTTFITDEFPADREEVGLHAFGYLGGNFNESVAFDDFTVQILGGYSGGSGSGFQPPIQH